MTCLKNNDYEFNLLNDNYSYKLNTNGSMIPIGHRGLGKTFDDDKLEKIE